jgi:hypothetical protein
MWKKARKGMVAAEWPFLQKSKESPKNEGMSGSRRACTNRRIHEINQERVTLARRSAERKGKASKPTGAKQNKANRQAHKTGRGPTAAPRHAGASRQGCQLATMLACRTPNQVALQTKLMMAG